MSLFVPKEWKDRLVEFSGRRKLTNVSTGEETTVDVSRAEGKVSQEGHAFSAANMNDLEQRIKDGFDKVDSDLDTLKKSVSDGKSSIASAITAKGVTTAADATFDTMANNIGKIQTDISHSVYAQVSIPNGSDMYIRIYKDGSQICNQYFDHKYGTFTTNTYTI